MSLTEHDVAWLLECWGLSLDDCDANGWYYEGEVVMTSLGYVDLVPDGSVVAFGETIHQLEIPYPST